MALVHSSEFCSDSLLVVSYKAATFSGDQDNELGFNSRVPFFSLGRC